MTGRSATWRDVGGHEVGCGLLLAGMGCWSMGRVGPGDWAPWVAWGLLALAGLAIWLDMTGPGAGGSWWRMGATPVVLVLFYFRLGVDVPRLVSGRADAALMGWDHRWLGETPAVSLAWCHSAWLTEAMSACYLGYFMAYVGYLAAWIRGGGPVAWRFVRGFCWVQTMGFAGYCMVPAAGPGMFMAGELPGLPMGWVGRLNDWVVRTGCNGVDVFPSLHVATTVYWVGFDVLEGRWRRLAWVALPAAGLCFSTLYLRYHYAVDVLAGLAVGSVGIAVAAGRVREWWGEGTGTSR